MKTAARSATSGAWALALAVLLALPAIAEASPREGRAGAHGKRAGHGSSRSDSRRPAQHSRAGARHRRSAPAARHQPSARHRARARRGVEQRARQQRSWAHQQTRPRQQNYQRPARPRGQMRRDAGRGSGRQTRRFIESHGKRNLRYQRYDHNHRGHRIQRFDGRVRRVERGSGGYRVWLDSGSRFFWVPSARFLLSPLRIGLSVHFGGYWNPAGYYNVYDYGPYSGGYVRQYSRRYSGRYPAGLYASGTVEGYVEQFDYATGALFLRDDGSGRLTTVLLRRDDPDFGNLQPGDWVRLSGAWTRNRNFEADRIETLVQR